MSNELVNAGLKAKKVTMAGGRTDGAYVEEYEAVGGLTIRDYFAAKALPTVMKNYCDYAEKHGYDEEWRMGIAIDAYSIADAMIKARSSV